MESNILYNGTLKTSKSSYPIIRYSGLRAKTDGRGKKGHHILAKGAIKQITINIFTINNSAPNFLKLDTQDQKTNTHTHTQLQRGTLIPLCHK